MIDVPTSLEWLRDSAQGRRWLAELPSLLERASTHWGLHLATPFPGGAASLVVPATMPNGIRVVLKVQFPDRESEHEAAALAAWDGRGAVRLLDALPEVRALLIERCEPGTPLSDIPAAAALDTLVGLTARLAIDPPPGIGSLAAEAERWSCTLPPRWEAAGRPYERRLVDAAVAVLRDLGPNQGPAVLLHQDLHGGNVLRAERAPWLVIDPKPLAGEADFQAAPIVRSAELGRSRADVLYRLDRLCDDLNLDRPRAAAWTFAQTLAWGFEHDRVLDRHVDVARWMVDLI